MPVWYWSRHYLSVLATVIAVASLVTVNCVKLSVYLGECGTDAVTYKGLFTSTFVAMIPSLYFSYN